MPTRSSGKSGPCTATAPSLWGSRAVLGTVLSAASSGCCHPQKARPGRRHGKDQALGLRGAMQALEPRFVMLFAPWAGSAMLTRSGFHVLYTQQQPFHLSKSTPSYAEHFGAFSFRSHLKLRAEGIRISAAVSFLS